MANTAILVGIDRVWDLEHWSVVRSVRRTFLGLYDSCATTRLRFKGAGDQDAEDDDGEMIINSAAVIVFNA